jgi:hypothetical protein
LDWNVAATLLLAVVLLYDRRGAHHVDPGTTKPDPDSLAGVAAKIVDLEASIAALRLEWTNAQLQLDRIAKRLARYAGDRPAADPVGAAAATGTVRRLLTHAELQRRQEP